MKNILVFIAIIFTFLFFPKENRWFMFHASEESFYGELSIKTKNEEFIIAKNLSNRTVFLPPLAISSNTSRQLENNYNFAPDSLSAVFPNSISFIQIDSLFNEKELERRFDNNYVFKALPLEMFTNVEKQFLILVYIVFSIVTGILVFFVTSFSIRSRQSFTYD